MNHCEERCHLGDAILQVSDSSDSFLIQASTRSISTPDRINAPLARFRKKTSLAVLPNVRLPKYPPKICHTSFYIYNTRLYYIVTQRLERHRGQIPNVVCVFKLISCSCCCLGLHDLHQKNQIATHILRLQFEPQLLSCSVLVVWLLRQ